MARVVITVEREGGSVITVEEQSAMPLFTDEQCGLLAHGAFTRTLGALGVTLASAPEPDPGGTSAVPDGPSAPAKLDRKAA